MSSLTDLARWLWIETQLTAPPFVQRTLIPRLHRSKEYARLLVKPYLPVYEWRGENAGGPLTVHYSGLGYAEALLRSLLFTTEPTEHQVGQLFVNSPNTLSNTLDSDIVIVETSKYLIDKLPQENAIRLPFRLQFILNTQGAWEDVEQRFRQDARRNEVRKAIKLGYDYEISHSRADLEMFYQKMYLPTVHNRHGELAQILPKQDAYQYLKHGFLFLTKRDGSYVSGGLCYVQDNILQFKEMGVLNGDKRLMRDGAVGAMNYLRIRWANQVKCRGVNLGSCWPYMSGIFQSKRKWGATVGVYPEEHKLIWIRIQRNTPAVSQFLENNPCVIRGANGNLNGLVISHAPGEPTPEMKKKWHKQYETPGLTELLIRSSADLLESPLIPNKSTGELA